MPRRWRARPLVQAHHDPRRPLLRALPRGDAPVVPRADHASACSTIRARAHRVGPRAAARVVQAEAAPGVAPAALARLAVEEAKVLGHRNIGTEHLLLGLIAVGEARKKDRILRTVPDVAVTLAKS